MGAIMRAKPTKFSYTAGKWAIFNNNGFLLLKPRCSGEKNIIFLCQARAGLTAFYTTGLFDFPMIN